MMGNKAHPLPVVRLAVLLLLAQVWSQATAEDKGGSADAAKTFRVREGFHGPLTLKSKQGKAISLNIGVQRWSIDGSLGSQSIRVEEFTLFQMRSGKIVTLVDGKEVIKTADDYWTVPAGAIFTFTVKGETALLEATSVSMK
jgi:hypothetical protein